MSLWNDEWVDENSHLFCGFNIGSNEIRVMNETQEIILDIDQVYVLIDRLNWAIGRLSNG